jgi:regulation of enolase protein 1 (concanavalin A-like superfamily)
MAQGAAVPSPWSARDIGSPAIAGTSSYDAASGTFSIDAAGTDIWGTSDQFRFIYQALTGDAVITARVDSVTYAHAWSKAGVMIRSSLSANAAHGFAFVSAGKGAGFQRRPAVGGSSLSTMGSAAVPPQWVRLARSGSTVTASISSNGTAWTTIGVQTIALGSTAYVGIAVTSHNPSQTTSADVSSVTAAGIGALPSPQKDQDIGSPAIAGSAKYSQGTYTVTAGGLDIWDSADQFHYVYQPVTGDVDVSVKVASLTNVSPWVKAGVMIRENLTPGSAHAFAGLSTGNGYFFQPRPAGDGLSVTVAGAPGVPPGWVRLKRVGDLFTAYRSTDGVTWTVIGSDSFPIADTVYVGIAVTSHNVSAATTAVLSNLTMNQVPPPANQPPTATLTAPANGAAYAAPATVSVTASAADADGNLSRVDFYNGATLLASDTTAPYAMSWSNVAGGTYAVKAIAVDSAGATGSSAVATITVSGNQAPTATLTSPANGAAFTAPATITLAANASDPNGTVARVDFYNGAALIGSDTTAPYAFTWGSVAAGTYTLKATAIDSAGASGSSAMATITVAGAASGLVRAFGFNEGTGASAGDTSGNGGTGTINGATWAAGRYGQALSFDGSDEVMLGDIDLPGAFTVMGWLQTRSLYTTGCASAVMKAFDYGIEMCGGELWASVGTGTGWSAQLKQTWTTADLNVWKHVAVSYDGATLRLYVDGVLAGSGTGTHATNNNQLILGRWTPASEYWNGLIDEIRVYSRALTAAEIQTDRTTPIAGGTSNQAPTATLTAPANGATFTGPASITLTANAADANGTVARVDFYNGTTLLGSDATAPYAFTWSSVAAGTYSVKATAVDNAGATGSSSVATITVTGTNQPPTATLTSPANGASFTAPASITLAANAADANGTIARVEFYNGSALLSTDTTAPYAFTWSSVAAGTYAIRAIAYDNLGASATSATATVTVSAVSTPPTAVMFQASADHATNVTSYLLEIFANGANPATATPVASSDLGKPTPAANGDITVNRATLFSALAPGTYVTTVSALGPGGKTRGPAVTFTR